MEETSIIPKKVLNSFPDMVQLNSADAETRCKNLLYTLEVYKFIKYYLE
jgi:hypothetical protein